MNTDTTSTKVINFEDAKNKKENSNKSTNTDDSLLKNLREEMRKETGYYE